MNVSRVILCAIFGSTVVLAADRPARAADEFKPPRISVVQPDWGAAMADLPSRTASSDAGAAAIPKLDALNEAIGSRFPNIAASTVPVLLPMDVEAYLRDRDADAALDTNHYLFGFRATPYFLAGPSGYDAMFELRSGATKELSNLRSGEPVFIGITGASRLVDLPAPRGAVNLPGHGLDREFPGLRRFIIENHMRFSFERYGVTYVVSILCFDGPARGRRVSCTDADRVGKAFLRALHFAGGTPQILETADQALERPKEESPDFAFHAPGEILPRTGVKGQGGVPDYTVYARIRFPMEETPAYVNSQAFMHWGNCNMTGRVGARGRKGASYRCRVNSKPLIFDESAQENYSYPWRDNFCEHRSFYVGQCPAGFGHQGQDIRPAECKLRKPDSDRCQPYGQAIVAARSGMILRPDKQDGLVLVTNAADGLLRFRYIHMNPRKLDADSMTNGRMVREGEIVGQVGNYSRYEGATTVHLHFEMMVPTRDGFVRVNPYATLIASYEQLIGARGKQIEPPATEAAPAIAAEQAEPEKPAAKRKIGKSDRKRGKTKRRR
ncbi:MAG: M23 family metallopeptidase [Pseudorhodoplanes sp.]|nr:M23 family metallopeptidase [Pseudorhodoplanes sp.]